MDATAVVADVRQGIRDVSPILVGIAPFGLIAGAAGIEAGLSAAQTMGLSVFVFAGASQLAAIELIGQGAGFGLIVVTALIINARMLMYSASIAPHILGYRERLKLLMTYVLTDQAYALSISRFQRSDLTDAHKTRYYLGVALTLWVVWQVTTAIGIMVGAAVPPTLQLDFAIPLVFLALLSKSIDNSGRQVAAIVGAVVAVLWALLDLRYNLGLLMGATAGVLGGSVWHAVYSSGGHR
jgi:Predicted branched-chain amino acid permease (azaleucine resistance)